MKIKEIKLYRINSGNRGEKGAEFGESQYWGGGWCKFLDFEPDVRLFEVLADTLALDGAGARSLRYRNYDRRRGDGLRSELWWRSVLLLRDSAAFQPVFDWTGPVQYRDDMGLNVPLYDAVWIRWSYRDGNQWSRLSAVGLDRQGTRSTQYTFCSAA